MEHGIGTRGGRVADEYRTPVKAIAWVISRKIALHFQAFARAGIEDKGIRRYGISHCKRCISPRPVITGLNSSGQLAATATVYGHRAPKAAVCVRVK